MGRTVCEATVYMEGLEKIYRRVWRQWCCEAGASVQAGGAAAWPAARATEATSSRLDALSTPQLSNRGLDLIRAGRAAEVVPCFESVTEGCPLPHGGTGP